MKPLRDLLGERLLEDAQSCAGFGIDWTGRYRGDVLAVARPMSTIEVSEILRFCNDAGVPVVPQGGNTGLVGGSVPNRPSLVLSTRGLRELGPIDPVSKQVTVGAGVTLAALHTHARNAGLEYGVDLGARDSATIGGTVATNAGGIHVVSNGMTRQQIVGIEAVLASGDVVSSMRGLAKDNTGYDLTQLLCGSEGTLGVITQVRVQLRSPWPSTTTAMFGATSYADAIAWARRITEGGARIRAAEVFDVTGLELAARAGHVVPSFTMPLVVLMEFVGEGELPEDTIVAMDERDRARLWQVRELLPDFIAREGLVHKLDIAVTPAALDATAQRIRAELAAPDVRVQVLFGHLLDGNLHVAFVGPEASDSAHEAAILRIVADAGGTISAEHGVGVQKAQALSLVRSAAEIQTMRAIKRALDPHGTLNPGVLFA